MNVPKIKPLAKTRGSYPQSKYPIDQPPFRLFLLGSPTAGKTTLLTNLIHKWLPKFDRYVVMTPSMFVDDSLQPTREFIAKINSENGHTAPSFYDHFNEKALALALQEQEEATDIAKKAEVNFLPTMLVVIDDLSDSAEARNSKALKSIFLRARHFGVSLIFSGHYLFSIAPICRAQITSYALFKPTNSRAVKMVQDSLSNIIEPDHLKDLWDRSVREKYGFLYINLRAENDGLMFLNSLKSALIKE